MWLGACQRVTITVDTVPANTPANQPLYIVGNFNNWDPARDTMARLAQEEDRLVFWLREAAADGRMKVEDPALAAQVFWATVSGGFYWPCLYLGPVDEETAAPLKEEMLALFLARYATDGSP